jgi:hypothetical protein
LLGPRGSAGGKTTMRFHRKTASRVVNRSGLMH